MCIRDRNIIEDVSEKEKSYIWHEEMNNESLTCKAKIDIFTSQGFLFDVKTCVQLEDIERRDMDKYRYDLQTSFYKRGLEKNNKKVRGVGIIAVEKEYPFHNHVFYVDDSYLKRGEYGGSTKYKRIMGWREALRQVHFDPSPRFKDKITTLSIN